MRYPREDEAWYQQHKGKKGVVDPKPCIRHIGDTISKSALMRRQLCADGHTMYMFSEELGSMKSVWKAFGDYFRKAFDQSEVGQDDITATSGVTHAQLNFTGCCTQNIFQKFFTDDNIEDGFFPNDARQDARYLLRTPQPAPRLYRGGAGQHPQGSDSPGA